MTRSELDTRHHRPCAGGALTGQLTAPRATAHGFTLRRRRRRSVKPLGRGTFTISSPSVVFPPAQGRWRTCCRGLSVIEVTMALLILSFAVAGLLQILTVAASQRRATEIRRLALEEIANQAEQIALIPWEELTAEKLAARQPSADLLAAAPSALMTVTTSDEAGPPTSMRIRITVAWTSPAGESPQPVQLIVWRHP